MQATIRIERYADQGRCVGHIDGRVVFVRFALPGELVRVELDEPHEREERFWTAEVVDVIEPSASRAEPLWPLAAPLAMGGGLGGADLIHVSAEGQLAWKSATIIEQMRRLGHVEFADVPVERMPGDSALQGLHWRTRIEMIADDEGRPSMRRRGSHIRVPVDTMPLASRATLAVAAAQHIWDGGFEPGAQLRLAVPEPRNIDTATANEQTLLGAVGDNFAALVNGELIAGSRLLHENVQEGREKDSGGMVSTDSATGNQPPEAKDRSLSRLKGRNTSLGYVVDANGFWQVHRQAPVALTTHVIELAQRELDGRTSATVWDLFSGSGLFTVPLAKMPAIRTRVLSVEGGGTAVRNAQRNLRRLDIGSVDARCGDVATVLGAVPADLGRPGVVVLDPPRAGARAKVCRQIAQAGARSIIYIACEPAGLARDTATLVRLGYSLADIRAFDIYPMTHHVETIALFRRTGA